jgi:hypothetical protein
MDQEFIQWLWDVEWVVRARNWSTVGYRITGGNEEEVEVKKIIVSSNKIHFL